MIEQGQRVRITTECGSYIGKVIGFSPIYCCGKQVAAIDVDGTALTVCVYQNELLPIEAPAVVGHA